MNCAASSHDLCAWCCLRTQRTTSQPGTYSHPSFAQGQLCCCHGTALHSQPASICVGHQACRTRLCRASHQTMKLPLFLWHRALRTAAFQQATKRPFPPRTGQNVRPRKCSTFLWDSKSWATTHTFCDRRPHISPLLHSNQIIKTLWLCIREFLMGCVGLGWSVKLLWRFDGFFGFNYICKWTGRYQHKAFPK